jgi:AcrR family transcriptional regulator
VSSAAPRQARTTPRAERTRAGILAAAESLFAERGFTATRLEDVAERVGIRRASIVYHFRDKRELYDAVLGDLFSGLLGRTREALDAPGPLPARIEAAVSAWVDYVGSRPSLPRLLLREVADASAAHETALLAHTQPFVELVRRLMEESRDQPFVVHGPFEAAHVASSIAGATVFFVAMLPTLVPDLGFDPLSPQGLEAHREQTLRITRRLLGMGGPRRASGARVAASRRRRAAEEDRHGPVRRS